MQKLFDKAATRDYTPLGSDLAKDLECLFATKAWSFREIILVITLARLLDRNYSASTAFYDCNPRAVYEGPIRTVLRDRGIPHTKSGPLNIAKAQEGINKGWAARRRPRDAALAAVQLVEAIEAMSPNDLENFAVVLHEKFLDRAEAVKALKC